MVIKFIHTIAYHFGFRSFLAEVAHKNIMESNFEGVYSCAKKWRYYFVIYLNLGFVLGLLSKNILSYIIQINNCGCFQRWSMSF